MSQSDAILAHLQSGATITPLDAFKLCGCLALHSRISELRERQYIIDCELVRVGRSNIGRYRLQTKVAYG